jgi:threonine 3-dehydrogenase
MPSPRILITGANGQIGSVLTEALRQRFGPEHVLATDIRHGESDTGPFELLNVLDPEAMGTLIEKYEITQIYHLAAILSAKGEEQPLQTWDINMQGLFNVFETARKYQLERVFFPSSIAVFGPEAPKENTPQDTALTPRTVYGISKAAGENWCQYYHDRYQVDIRSVRYPGIIGHQSLPGGGTTDYAVEIFHSAVKGETYTCFLREDTPLPMMFMEDAIRATIDIMQAPAEQVQVRTSYNLAATSFTPAEITAEIRKIIPDFEVVYQPDHREQIARSWPQSIDDSVARKDWGWQPEYDLTRMCSTMIEALQAKLLPE